MQTSIVLIFRGDYMDSLPHDILRQILSRVACYSMHDFGNARIAYRGFNYVGRDDLFYKTADLLFMRNDYLEENAVTSFKLQCYQAGNPEAIYLRGMYEYFMLHMVDKERLKIRIAGERGCPLANYVDKMLNLAYSVDGNGLVHNHPDFNRQHVLTMSNIMDRLSGHRDYVKPAEFCSIWERIDPNHDYSCWCYNLEPPVFEKTIEGRMRWKCDRCFWQYESWGFCNDVHLTAREWPIED